ncbi:hypothetical protein HK099_005356 [Clydaea vesicula]|uniref:Serine protease n=1 Tax=Clydaea vesicula TaxID=447962 RepID=A0AAD5XV04_9FUNG|nr:hypothetical protein HK099_005356 [Clydaea vesicula]
METLSIPCDSTLNYLYPKDKLTITGTEKILEDLTVLKVLLNSTFYATKIDRVKLRNAVQLATYLNFSNIDDCKSLVEELSKPPKFHLTKAHRDKIIPYVDYLLQHLRKDTSVDELGTLFKQKLELTPFENFTDLQSCGVNDDLRKVLREAGAWRIAPDYKTQQFLVWGNVSSATFFENIKDVISPSFINYSEKKRTVLDRRDDCWHSGCSLKDSFSEVVIDYRELLAPKVQEVIEKYSVENVAAGTIGMFITNKKRNKHYLITSAHVAFPELSSMALDGEDLKLFNESVPYAHYSKTMDIAVIPCNKNIPHDNGIRIAPLSDWNYLVDEGAQIYKMGGRSGLTVGILNKKNDENENYKNCISVQPTKGSFTEKGDSGSIYYCNTITGFVPLGIHRITDGVSFACPLLESLRYVVEDKQRRSIDDYEPCMWHQQLGCCTYRHTK